MLFNLRGLSTNLLLYHEELNPLHFLHLPSTQANSAHLADNVYRVMPAELHTPENILPKTAWFAYESTHSLIGQIPSLDKQDVSCLSNTLSQMSFPKLTLLFAILCILARNLSTKYREMRLDCSDRVA